LALCLTSGYAKKSKKVKADVDDTVAENEIVDIEAAKSSDDIIPPPADATSLKKDSYTTAFVASFSTIVVSELGDKTFFIAAIMAMRYNRLAVLIGALTALFVMTGISTVFG